MKHFKKNQKTQEEKNQQLLEAAKKYGKIDNKQIVGHVEIRHPNEKKQYCFILEDGSEVFEDEDGKSLEKLKKLPLDKREKR